MKKFYLLLVIIMGSQILFAQTLFTYGKNPVGRDEFLRAYNKNKTYESNNSKALREYLDLYVRFKLKVQAAKDLHIDTLSTLQSELQNFRWQIEPQYLQDEKLVDELLNEAFIRSQKDIHISHLYIPLNNKTNPLDSTDAYKAAQLAYKALTVNHSAFSNVAADLVRSNTQASWDDVGYITVFSIPYELENVVYNLKPGQISKPMRTTKGYHIFQNIEERKAAGKIRVAQILIAFPSDANIEIKDAAYRKADSVYRLIQKGADFGELAKRVSNDQTTYMSGGVIPEFGIGTYDDMFERKIVALQKDGNFTLPFQTQFGYHIVKRLGRTPVPAQKTDATYMAGLRQQLQGDVRVGLAKKKFLTNVFKRTGYKKNSALKESVLWQLADSFITSGKKLSVGGVTEKSVLHSFSNHSVKVNDWLQFARDYKTSPELYKGETFKELMEKYVELTALENYRKRLEEFNPEFKYQIQEFKEGNMLFEVMERNIWSRAANDTVGLKNYYAKNKAKYTWNESADAVLISAANADIAKQIQSQIKGGKNWRQAVELFSTQVQSDSGRYEVSQIPGSDKEKFSAGMVTDPVVNSTDGTATLVVINKLYPAHQQRSFEEARGLVINDYQILLEDQWIEELKKTYPVKVNDAVFKSIPN